MAFFECMDDHHSSLSSQLIIQVIHSESAYSHKVEFHDVLERDPTGAFEVWDPLAKVFTDELKRGDTLAIFLFLKLCLVGFGVKLSLKSFIL